MADQTISATTAMNQQTGANALLSTMSLGDTLRFNPGVYICDEAIVSNNKHLDAVDPTHPPVIQIRPNLPGTRTGRPGYPCEMASGWASQRALLEITGGSVRNLVLDGNYTHQPNYCEGGEYLNLMNLRGGIAENNILQNGINDGIAVKAAGCTIRNNICTNVLHDTIALYFGANTVEGNYIYGSKGWHNSAFRIYNGRDNVFRYNVSNAALESAWYVPPGGQSSGGQGMAFEICPYNALDVGNMTIESNVIMNSSSYAGLNFYEAGGSGIGGAAGYRSGFNISNNLFINCKGYGGAIIFSGSRTGTTPKHWNNVRIVNNTFVGNKYAVLEEASTTDGNIIIKNNIFADSLTANVQGASSLMATSYNLRNTGLAGSGVALGAGNILGNPLFVDPANYNFSLQPGSPARTAGEGGVSAGANISLLPAIFPIPVEMPTDGSGTIDPDPCPRPRFNFNVYQ